MPIVPVAVFRWNDDASAHRISRFAGVVNARILDPFFIKFDELPNIIISRKYQFRALMVRPDRLAD